LNTGYALLIALLAEGQQYGRSGPRTGPSPWWRGIGRLVEEPIRGSNMTAGAEAILGASASRSLWMKTAIPPSERGQKRPGGRRPHLSTGAKLPKEAIPGRRERSKQKGTTVMRENEGISEQTDLWTQLEDLLRTVHLAEANWQLDDRIDLAVRLARSREKRSGAR
jgi:hypothetical protein